MTLPEALSASHYDYLDGWRGLAIGFLLLGHFFPVPGINLGAVGVNLFFVLSGLLMGRLLFEQDIPIGLFYRRRISRILPAHVFFIALMTIACSALGLPINFKEIASAALFLNNYWTGEPGQGLMPFGHIWSLSVEEHSYVLLSLVAIGVRMRKAPFRAVTAIATLCCVSAFAAVWYWTHYTGSQLHFGKWLQTEVSAFGILASVLCLLLVRANVQKQLPALVVPCLFLVGLAMHWWSVPAPVRLILGVGALALAVNLLFTAPQWLRTVLSVRPLRQLGLWSFSIYLWQQPFYLLSHRDGISALLALILAILAGIGSYYCIERPVRRYLNRSWAVDRRSGTPGAARPDRAEVVL